MAIIIKENQALAKNMYEIPKDLESHLQDTLAKFGQYKQSQGYKRLNSLVNPDYNKRSDKEDRFKDGKHISFSDLKRIDHEFRHMDKNPKNLKRILNGGEEMARFAKETLDRERTKVEPVLKQKKVETRTKNALKPSENPTKPITVGNITANVHEQRKVYISEKQAKLLIEDKNQLMIPFDGSTERYNYLQFLDWIEEIGIEGQLPQSQMNFEKEVQKSFQAAYEALINDEEGMCEEAMNDFFDSIYSHGNEEELNHYFPNLSNDEIEYCMSSQDYSEMYDDFKPDAEFEIFRKDYFRALMRENGFPYSIRTNDRGLIFIERAIDIPPKFMKSLPTNKYGRKRFIDFLYDMYGENVGQYWSYSQGEVQDSAWSRHTTLYLRGYVRPEDVDIFETTYRNMYSLHEEHEIYLPYGTQIELFEIITEDGKKLPLRKPIIVKA
jgi:hypothetical protein